MSQNYHRRHSRWYEVIIFNFWFQLIIGFLLVVLLPQWLRYGGWVDSLTFKVGSNINTLYANSVAFILSFLILRKLYQFPGARNMTYIFPVIAANWLFIIAILFFMRAEYARSIVASSYIFANLWAFAGFFLGKRYYTPKIALIPFGTADQLYQITDIDISSLKVPTLQDRRFDALVTDLHYPMPNEWQKFLAECTLSRIPIYHSQQFIEQFTGRVKLDRLSENTYGSLYPSPVYELFKRIMEFLMSIILIPLWLPIILITGIIIKIDSPGPIFFKQTRVGLGNRDFTVYKLRSMRTDSEKNGAQFASKNDSRITRVGKFIRKTRIDELPQFINIIKGEMSLIGPRPEQRSFVEEFEKDIPFYTYRHIIKPGVTGWAQVTQGYAASEDETRIKLEHDFYYIKNFSFWLDVLILLKTIRIILTKKGAR